jgi:uncharacterized NAD-dependent epimerase/dehydratase family protein
VIERITLEGRLTNPNIQCVGIAVNTEALDESAALKLLEDTAAKYDLPSVDPIRTGVAAIVDELVRRFH